MCTTKVKPMKNILRDLLTSRVQGYANLPIPTELDGEITGFIEAYLQLNRLDRWLLRRRIKDGHKFVLLAFAERMASAAVRKSSSEDLYYGLYAIFLQAGRGDFREDLIVLALLYDAARRIAVSPRDLFWDAGGRFRLLGTSMLREFLDRPEEINRPEVMGYEAGADKDGFRYVRSWGDTTSDRPPQG